MSDIALFHQPANSSIPDFVHSHTQTHFRAHHGEWRNVPLPLHNFRKSQGIAGGRHRDRHRSPCPWPSTFAYSKVPLATYWFGIFSQFSVLHQSGKWVQNYFFKWLLQLFRPISDDLIPCLQQRKVSLRNEHKNKATRILLGHSDTHLTAIYSSNRNTVTS